MITPDYLDEIIKGTEKRVAELNDALVKKIADRIKNTYKYTGEYALIPSSISDLHKMMALGKTSQEIMEEMQRMMPEIKEEVRKAFVDAAQEIGQSQTNYARSVASFVNRDGGNIFVPDYESVGITNSASRYGLTPAEIRRLEMAYERTNGTIDNLTRTTSNECQTEYINACNNAYMQIQHGVSPSTAIMRAIDDVATKGIIYTYFGNYRQSIEISISRAVRTGVNQANADISLTRCSEMGCDYVLVSEHYGARVTNTHDYKDHSWWQGQVYKLNWRSANLSKYTGATDSQGFEFLSEIRQALAERGEFDYPDFDETCGYGDILGICGINCRHTFSNYYPGIQEEPTRMVDPDKNEEYYKHQQKARSMEREIRKTNRRLGAIKDVPGPYFGEKRKELKRLLESQDSRYREFCRENRIPQSNARIYVGK